MAPATTRPGTVLTAALLVLCQSLQPLAYGGIPEFLPAIRTVIGLNCTQSGALSAHSTLVYALMQIPAGYLADRLSARRIILVGLVGLNLLAINFTLLHHYELLVLNQAILGFFRALVSVPGMLLMSALFPPDRRATAMGPYVAAGSSPNIFLNALGLFLARCLGWRTLFVVSTTAGLVVTTLCGRLGALSSQAAKRRSFPLDPIPLPGHVAGGCHPIRAPLGGAGPAVLATDPSCHPGLLPLASGVGGSPELCRHGARQLPGRLPGQPAREPPAGHRHMPGRPSGLNFPAGNRQSSGSAGCCHRPHWYLRVTVLRPAL